MRNAKEYGLVKGPRILFIEDLKEIFLITLEEGMREYLHELKKIPALKELFYGLSHEKSKIHGAATKHNLI